MRKLSLVVLAILLLLLSVMPVYAMNLPSPTQGTDQGITEITTFGGNDLRDRVSSTTSLNCWTDWKDDFNSSPGTSYSQPLIIYNPNNNNTYIIAVGGGNSPKIEIWKNIDINPKVEWQSNPHIWEDDLPGSLAPESHPSLYDINGHDIVFIGTNATSNGHAAILGYDVTGILDGTSTQATKVLDYTDPHTSDIVSAPLLMYWQSHPVLIYTSGSTSQVELMFNIDSLGNGQEPSDPIFHALDIGTGGGATTSSPSPVMDGKAFVMGWDDGSKGAIYVYRLDAIFESGTNGTMTAKSSVQPYGHQTVFAGMDQSFSVDPSNTNDIYFGDSRSNVYGFNTQDGTALWANRDIPSTYGYPDDFSNRSPALGNSYIFFPFGTSPKTPFGGIIAVNKDTGQTVWVSNGGKSLMGYDQYGNPTEATNVQTAPAIVRCGSQDPVILVGLGNGQVEGLDSSTGQVTLTSIPLAISKEISSYAKGITGEISVLNNMVAITYDDGILVIALKSLDLAITGLDPGCPKDADGNYIAKGGQSYTATVKYSYLQSPTGSSYELDTVPVGGFHNIGGKWSGSYTTGGTWYATGGLTDSSGQALPQTLINSEFAEYPESNYYVSLDTQGQTGEYQFKWTAETTDSETVLAAVINKDFYANNPLVEYYPEQDLTNNDMEVPVNIETPELVIQPASTTIQVGDTQQYTAEYYPDGQAYSSGQDVTSSAAWSSSGSASSINSSGLATGKSAGTVTITASYKGVTGTAQLTIAAGAVSSSSGSLSFKAVSQYGNYQRQAGTAKWTDTVTATLTPGVQGKVGTGQPSPTAGTVAPPYPSNEPTPPAPNATLISRESIMTDWHLTGATLVYPKENPDYTYDNPLQPEGTVSDSMKLNGKNATAIFKEMWSEDGADVYDVLTGSQVPGPHSYTITANFSYSVDYYELFTFKWVQEIKERKTITLPDGTTETETVTTYKTVEKTIEVSMPPYAGSTSLSGSLLVNGSGVSGLGI